MMVDLLEKPKHILYHARLNSEEIIKAINLAKRKIHDLYFRVSYQPMDEINLMSLLNEDYDKKMAKKFEKLGIKIIAADQRSSKNLSIMILSKYFPKQYMSKEMVLIDVYSGQINKENEINPLFRLYDEMLCDSRKNPDNKNDYEKNSMNLVIFDEQFKNQKMKQKKEKLKKLFLQKLI